MKTVVVTVLLALAAAAPAQAARSNDFEKPVAVVTGPEFEAPCAVVKPLLETIKRETVSVDGKPRPFGGKLLVIGVGAGAGGTCGAADVKTVPSSLKFQDAAAEVAQKLSTFANGKPIDAVGVGTGGLLTRFALTMSARNRLGQRAANETAFPATLAIEDAVAIASPMGGTLSGFQSCGTAPLCSELDPDDDGPNKLLWSLMTAAIGNGTNPQGVGGTDWSVVGLEGNKRISVDTSLGMDANHKTVYIDPTLSLEKGLADRDSNRTAQLRFSHVNEKGEQPELTRTNSGTHLLRRVIDDLVYGDSRDVVGKDGAYAEGCVGFNDSGTGETLIADPKLPGFGSDAAVRVVRAATIDAAATCFKKTKDGAYTINGPAKVRINGIDFQPQRVGDTVKIFAKERRVVGDGIVKATIPVPVIGSPGQAVSTPLWTFEDNSVLELDWKFPAGDGDLITDSGERFSGEIESKIRGIQAKGGVTLSVTKGQFNLGFTVELPGIFGSAAVPKGGLAQCENGQDDDRDGKVDKADDDCEVDDLYYPGKEYEGSRASGFSANLRTSNSTGVGFDKFGGKIAGAVQIGSFKTAGSTSVDYSAKDGLFKVVVEATIPALKGIDVKLKVDFTTDSVKAASVEVKRINVLIPPTQALWLQRIALGASNAGAGAATEFLIGLGVSVGPAAPDGKTGMSIDGTLSTSFGPLKAQLDASLGIAGTTVGTGSLAYENGAGAKFAFTLGRPIKFNGDKLVVKPIGTLQGAMSNFGEIDAGADVSLCIKGETFFKDFEDEKCIGRSSMRVTRFKGQPIMSIVCFTSEFEYLRRFSVGFKSAVGYSEQTKEWAASTDWITNNCDVADWGAKANRQAGGGPPSVSVGPDEDALVFGVLGKGGAPNVVLVGPDGTRLPLPADGMAGDVGDGKAFAMTGMGDRSVFMVAKPAAGRWTVETLPGSPAVEAIQVAETLPEPKVTATVRQRGKRFVLRHSVTAPGQVVRLYDRSGSRSRLLATSRGGRGRRVFRPSSAAGGGHEIVAVVMNGASVRRELKVARFTVPRPARPGRVRGVKVKRRGDGAVVTWKKTRNAGGGYSVRVTRGDAVVYGDIVRKRRVVLRDVAPGRLVVEIAGLRAGDQLAGPELSVRR